MRGGYDECGVCNGNGAIFECGCGPLPENACECDAEYEFITAEECDAYEGSVWYFDFATVPVPGDDARANCGDGIMVQKDCAGICGGDAVEDDCGVCNGPGPDDGCCDENKDCAGVCDGTAIEDCNGDCDGALIDIGEFQCIVMTETPKR